MKSQMKKSLFPPSTIVLLIITLVMLSIYLFSCKKETGAIKMDEIKAVSATMQTPIIENVTYQSNSITYTKYGSMQLLFRRTSYNGFSNCCLSTMNGKTVYLAFDMVDENARMSNIVDPNLIPFDNILPPGTNPSWKSCLWNAIKDCARVPLCNNGTCAREAIVACIASWSVGCLFAVVSPVPTFVIKPIKLNVSTLPVHYYP